MHIRDVDAIFSSKSQERFHLYPDLDAMAQAERPGQLVPGCHNASTMQRYLEKAGILPNGAFQRRGDFLDLALWDGRLSWMNDGGSHNFAAARCIAGAIGLEVPLTARLVVRSISPVAIDALAAHFEIFVVPGDPVAKNAILEALRISSVSHFTGKLPQPFRRDDGAALFLPRAEEKSMRAAATPGRGRLLLLERTFL